MRTRKLGAFEAEYPTFLYAMPMTKTRVFFEVLMLRVGGYLPKEPRLWCCS
ncbi:hypothetical protein Bca4012_090354 [Brassica carinata]|uniref:Uncharacterized protein n=1 Tax=Brassica oleracea var. oleracea TaxID=109376 RepID=A0A0D3ACH5_BRAOL